MLVPLVARIQCGACLRHDEFASWTQAVVRLREACERRPVIDVAQIVSFLEGVPQDQRREAMVDLICEHLKQSWRHGLGCRVEDYLPILMQNEGQEDALGRVPAEIIEEEFLARHAVPFGDAPDVAEYRRRFGDRKDAIAPLARRVRGAGRFVALRRAGIGAAADVWEAFDREARAHVALKVPRRDATAEADSWGRLAREARLMADLDHPGIVNLREYRTKGETPVYAMRLVTGKSYLGAIREHHDAAPSSRRVQPEATFRQLLDGLASACEAMQYAHNRGIVHGDLTPANILVSSTGEAAIIDWGSARALETTEERLERGDGIVPTPQKFCAGSIVPSAQLVITGTPEYMAPEQLLGSVDKRTDIFGLGAVLYELLTGRSPYARDRGRRSTDWRQAVLEARFEHPRRCNPTASRSLAAVCLKAMARDAERRFTTMAEFAAAIRHCADESSRLSVASVAYRAWRRLIGCQ